MAVKDLLSKFRSISRPSLGKTTSASAFSSYAKKQQAAEDAILDNQYESGTLSPEAYLSALNSRLTRTTNTPLTNVNIQEKIQKTQVKVNDAIVANKAASGEYSTADVLEYEKQKLSRMTEAGSPAYLAQQQKIQQLTDRSEKEARTNFRNAEMLRISQTPGDNSATLWEKAQVYKTLAEQARLDGDTQQATTLETQYNNAVTSAKRADVNDIITGARLSVSGTPTAGLGTPTSQAGASRLAGDSPGQGGGSTAGVGLGETRTASPAVTTGFSGVSNSAVNNALKTLDAKYKSYERTANAINDDNTMIAKYQEAINAAEGDQKTQLTIAYNNLLDSKAQKENALGILEEGINETVVRIQEIQQKAAAGAFSQEVRKTNQQFDKAESELETAFAKGEINKEEYIAKGIGLAEMKTQYYGQASDVFSQYGNDASADSYLEKASKMEEVHQSLINTATNLDNWEPIAADPGGKLTNLFGKQVQPGDVSLVDVTKLKDSGDFDANYVNDNGVYKRVYYPGKPSDLDGGYYSKSLAESLAKEATKPEDAPFVYGKGIGPMMKTGPQPLTKTSNGQWVTPSTYQEMKSTANSSLDKVLGKTNLTQQVVEQAKKQTPVTKVPSLIDRLFTPLSSTPTQEKKPNVITSAIGNLVGGAKDWLGNAISGAKNIFSSAKDKFASATQNVGLPPLVKKAYAAGSVPDSEIEKIIAEQAKAYGVDFNTMLEIARAESGLDPAAAARKSGYDGKTIDKRTGKPYPYSSAEGLFQFTDATWKDAIKAGVIPPGSRKDDPTSNAKAAAYFISKGQIGKWDASKDKWAPKIAQSPKLEIPKVVAAESPQSPGIISSNGTYLHQSYKQPNGISGTTITKQTPQVKAPSSPIPSFIPPLERIAPDLSTPSYSQPTQRPGTTFTADVIKPAIQKVQAYVAPKIQAVQKAAAPVVQKASNFVSNAVSSTKNFLSNLFKRK